VQARIPRHAADDLNPLQTMWAMMRVQVKQVGYTSG